MSEKLDQVETPEAEKPTSEKKEVPTPEETAQKPTDEGWGYWAWRATKEEADSYAQERREAVSYKDYRVIPSKTQGTGFDIEIRNK